LPFSLLQKDIQAFIKANATADLTKLALQKNPFPEVEWIAILNQIEAKTKAKEKLMKIYYKSNKALISDDYIYEHIELDDDLKPYLNLRTPPPKIHINNINM
jgi:hypothetical protein